MTIRVSLTVKGLHVSHADLKILFGSEKDITMEKLLDLLRSNKLPDDFDPAISAYNVKFYDHHRPTHSI